VFLEERRQAILHYVASHGRAAVPDLSEAFEVSEVTIRADLQALAEQGQLIRTHGGAIPLGYGLHELSLMRRRQQNVTKKARIAEAAAEYVGHGEAIFLDSSSTTLAIVNFIRRRQDLTVVTNSLVVAQELLGVRNITVVMPGGVLHHDTGSLIDAEGLALLARYNIVTGFFGAHGITIEDGLTDVSASEADLKRELVALCRQVIALLDATKWGRAGVASFAGVADVDRIITDDAAPPEIVAAVSKLDVVDVLKVGALAVGEGA
jgi:DeoR family transcriptional regulator, aga operon transcriptional repressor